MDLGLPGLFLGASHRGRCVSCQAVCARVPTFCRHNRLLQHCPICAREQHVDLTPLISPSAPRSGERGSDRSAQPGTGRRRETGEPGRRAGTSRAGKATGLRVRRLERGVDDGYQSQLAPGLRSSVEAERLAQELAFAATRLRALAEDPPGLYAEVAAPGDIEERAWLGFLIAYLCPLDEEDPFAAIQAARTPWRSVELPELAGVRAGPRGALDETRPLRTLEAYRAWAARAGSQAEAYAGEVGWSAERRFGRLFERLALPGLHRDARFDLLVTLGWLDVFELRPGELMLGGTDAVTVGAKRVFGIGERHVLEGRAAALARESELPLAALDVALYNWQHGQRAWLGLPAQTEPESSALAGVRAALGL